MARCMIYKENPKYMKRLFPCSFVIALLILSGCAQPPTVELSAAQKAIDDAHAAQADMYAAAEFGAAQKALTDARTEITNQDKNFVLTRNYTGATNLLKDVETKAQAAQAAAKGNKEKAKSEVEALIQETTASLEAAKTDLDKAPKSKNAKAELDSLKTDLDTLSTKLDQAKAVANSGDYLQAKASLTEVKQRVTDIAAERQHAAEKTPAKGKTKVS
jgi:soluble cytochrome b562